MWRAAGVWVGVSGCTFFAEVRADLDRATHPLVVSGLVVETSPVPGLAPGRIGELPLLLGATEARVVIYDLGTSDEEGQAVPIEGARVWSGEERAALPELGEGEYGGTVGGYVVGGSWTVQVEVERFSEPGALSVVQPDVVPVTLPAWHPEGEPLALSWQGEGFPFVWGFVHEPDSGLTRWNNFPEQAQDLSGLQYRDEVFELTLPRSAFEGEGELIVGVVGVRFAAQEDRSGVNGLVSTVAAGRALVRLVQVGGDRAQDSGLSP